MNLKEIERLLSQGESVGFRTVTDDPEYLGWVLVSKLKADEQFLERFSALEAPRIYQEQLRRRLEPYLVLRIELKRSVHEAGDYETEEDYRRKEDVQLATLEDVEKLLAGWGLSFADAKESRELDTP